MKFDIAKLSDAERQELMDGLHAASVVPTVLIGTGSPAHVAMLSAAINDMRQVVSLQSTNLTRLFAILERQGAVLDKQSALIERLIDQPGLEPKLPGERGN